MEERDRQAREARRELERLKEEGGLFATPTMKSKARSVRGHFAASDADQSDPIEVWGARIGRGLGAVALVLLAVLARLPSRPIERQQDSNFMQTSGRPQPVIAISSHVVRGAVGNRAVVFALERFGHPVWALPTVTLPWHPGHGPATRLVAPAEAFDALVGDLIRAPWLGEVSAVISGYLGDQRQAEGVAQLVSGRARAASRCSLSL